MPTLTDYIAVAIEMAPLFIALDLVPTLIASLIDDYVTRKCLLKPAGEKTAAHSMLSYSPITPKALYPGAGAQLYSFAIFVILVAPFVEEIVFRGVPLLIHPTLAWVGTIGWALAHPIRAVATLEMCPHNRKLALINALSLSCAYLASGVFYMLIWLRGFTYGAVAISYHCFHNLIVFLSSVLSERIAKKRRKAVKMPKRRVTGPIAPPPQPEVPVPLARRILRYVGLENSVSPATGEAEEAERIAHAIHAAREMRRRILREV